MKFPISNFQLRVDHGLNATLKNRAGFTMIEIALCLAIIGFALVAIIAVLPTGLNVQRDNREETIINQDAVVWANSIRNGAQGYNDLTNYVIAITNFWTTFHQVDFSNSPTASGHDDYTLNYSKVTSVSGINQDYMSLTNGRRIIGLMSTPQFTPPPPIPASGVDAFFQSNYIVAHFRAFSGAAVELAPQKNDTILGGAFSYRMVIENVSPVPTDPASVSAQTLKNLRNNSRDMRLLFRWPILPNGDIGNGRHTFRLFTGGSIEATNDFYVSQQPLYFFQPSIYTQARQQQP
jgi:type II secretory pathway pseudopilin PulG